METSVTCVKCQSKCLKGYTAICTCNADGSVYPETYGVKLHINVDASWNYHYPLIIDVETDEKDNFVGFAWTQDGINIYYQIELPATLACMKLVGHNVKFDMKQFIGWGFLVKSNQMHYDTILASYVHNTTKDSHGLKDLAKELLGMEWPSYKDMVGTGKKKVTLDKQPIEKVAAYCGMDCLATYRLYEHFKKTLTKQETKYLEEIELPTARALLDMELRGVQVDVKYLQSLDATFGLKLDELKEQVIDQALDAGILHEWVEEDGDFKTVVACVCCGREETDWVPNGIIEHKKEEFNINSNRQIADLLITQGAILPRTPKGNLKVDKATLEQWKHLPAVPLLLEYSKIEKLKSTYTESLLEKQNNGRIYCSFNQISRSSKGTSVGISTGRLSSSDPNLQNIPTRTEEGALLRKAFVAGPERVFIDADFSQIEPRLVAHFTKDKTFVEAFRQGRNIYGDLVEGIPLPQCKTDKERYNCGKTFMLALLYGAQPKKLASVFKCSEKDAERIIEKIMKKLPGVTAWINRVKYEAHQKGGVRTLFGRWIPLPMINSRDRYERLHWERVAVNTIIQGSAAEVLKKSLIKLHELGYSTVLNVHDEMLTEVDLQDEQGFGPETHSQVIQQVMEQIVKLDVPLKVDVGIGENWGVAKE